MITKLPSDLIDFLYWWAIRAPKRILSVSKRIFILVNYDLSLTLHIRLIFVPLFNDFTKVGRVIGFFMRLLLILTGIVVFALLSVLFIFVPITWYVAPLLLIYFLKLWSIPIFVSLFILHQLVISGTPKKRVTLVGKGDIIKSFRPEAEKFLNLLFKLKGSAVPMFLKFPRVYYILKKAELLNPEVEEKISGPFVPTDLNAFAKLAFDFAVKHGVRYVETEHVFLAVLATIPKVDSLLSYFSSSEADIEEAVKWVVSNREALSRIFLWQEDFVMPKMGGVNKGLTGRVTPNLDAVSEDFTENARKGYFNKIVGREKEIKEISQTLSSSSSENVMIIGEPGSGKTSLVKAMAFMIIKGTEFKSLTFKRIISIEAGSLLAGTKSAGDIAGKIKLVFDEAVGSGDVIIFIDEIHELFAGSSDQGESYSAFSILQSYLSSEKLQFIGATNVKNYRKYIEPNGAFARLFQVIEIPEASKEDTVQILKVVADKFEKDYSVVISYPSLLKAVALSEKLIHERVLPDKAIDILGRAATSARDADKYIVAEGVAIVVSEMTNVPVTSITDDESQKLLKIEDEMKKKVIGQDQAIVQIGNALRRARVGIRNEDKPIASFLFVGTTGVGKTETAKTLADVYFGDKKAMIRIDMSEYQQQDSIDRLVGAPDGSTKGILTEAVRLRPFSLILLDEIEKAYSNILLTFLQVLDDGRLTDSSGMVIDFTNTIIIATSNVGTRAIQDVFSKGSLFQEMEEVANKEVRDHFAPEFLNRFSGIIVFKPLDMDSVKKITDLMLNKIRNMAIEKDVKINFKPELIDELAKRGFSPEWGARPLARVIEDSVENYLAKKLLSNEINKGDEVTLGLEVFDIIPQ
ncbi:hypothetical protein A3H26_00300 [candidate division WWE3 bacterium RIFCSPLOWO2_12_FULL_36_10]|uniref:Clp R domain-containing protein n=1 Tax=candidate division WWE3 bacterium RIFCSPLOWO2_12_FULL_36_10 TaxID=1802630 RepID=A0A1F4VGJ6_UNCKA|nr:MAG: hypothetical protein A3H26_00300 [candidate division WWE3 bacterium RIFCSPLOWO2_12_FULL_36_10]